MKSFNRFLQSQEFVLICVILALVCQFPTTAYFFHKIQVLIKPDWEVWPNWVLSFSYALVAEFCILLWSVKANKSYTWGYCIITMGINCMQILDIGKISPYLLWGGLIMFIAAPLSIALLSEQFVSKMNTEFVDMEKYQQLEMDLQKAIDTNKATKSLLDMTKTELDISKQEIEDRKKELVSIKEECMNMSIRRQDIDKMKELGFDDIKLQKFKNMMGVVGNDYFRANFNLRADSDIDFVKEFINKGNSLS